MRTWSGKMRGRVVFQSHNTAPPARRTPKSQTTRYAKVDSITGLLLLLFARHSRELFARHPRVGGLRFRASRRQGRWIHACAGMTHWPSRAEARGYASLHAADVLARPRIDLDRLVLSDEQRDAHDRAGLQRRRLAAAAR